jgi:hypothetical protein
MNESERVCSSGGPFLRNSHLSMKTAFSVSHMIPTRQTYRASVDGRNDRQGIPTPNIRSFGPE